MFKFFKRILLSYSCCRNVPMEMLEMDVVEGLCRRVDHLCEYLTAVDKNEFSTDLLIHCQREYVKEVRGDGR